MNNISRKIYSLRTNYNLTQAQLAKIAGVSDKAISAWELGTRDPKIKSIQKICAHFGIDVYSFIDQSTEVYNERPTPVPESGLPDQLTVRLNELLAQASEETKQAMIVLLEQSQKP